MQQLKDKDEVGVNGVHTLTTCASNYPRAHRLSELCEDVRREFTSQCFKKNRSVMPLQLKLCYLNMQLSNLGVRNAVLEDEQRYVLDQIHDICLQTDRIFYELWSQYREYIDELHSKYKTNETITKNITTTVGRSVLASRLGGDVTYTGIVNYTALGSDNTAAVVGDATLGNETYRKALSSGTNLNNVAYLETFYTAAEVTGTFEEYGMFIDGSGSADTGQLFNRFVSNITKSGTETLNVQSVITLSDS